MSRVIRRLRSEDCAVISSSFGAIGWNKPTSQYEAYLREQDAGARVVFVAECDGVFAGYGCVLWESTYQPFRDAGIPEIVDLNVLTQFRRIRIASSIMDAAEAEIVQRALKERAPGTVIAGIAVGLYPDYGPAQRMYVRRGYVPDGRGVSYDGRVLAPLEATVNDDALNLHLTRTLLA